MNKKNLKSVIKQLSLGYITAFVASFMLYIYEPILTYSANIDDFWFDLSLMLPNIILYTLIMFTGISFTYTIIYIISKNILKKENIYNSILAISWIIFIYTYIQGNFLIGALPVLDGTTINWNDFFVQNIISVVILVILVIGEIFAIKKITIKKTIKINTYITLVVLAMLMASFISVLCTPNLFIKKTITTSTNENIDMVSSEKNFFIFLVDAVASRTFNEVLEESPEYSDTFKDFTYFEDAAGGYAVTKESIPLILTGKWSKNEKRFTEFYNEAFDESKLFEMLEKENYNMNFYEPEPFCNRKNAERFENFLVDVDKVDKVILFKQLTKYLLFKYLPYQLKQYSRIETADFKICRVSPCFNWANEIMYGILRNEPLKLEKDKYFKFIHIEGGHVPFDFDENLNRLPEETGTYEMKVKSTLKLIDEFINGLRKCNAYDNSVIIVMADHGVGETTDRANPILFIKGINEHHKMLTSEIPVSYGDLQDAYEQLLDDKKSTELFQDIAPNRERTYIRNFFENEDHMEEYVIKGKAYESDKIEKTGVEYNR